MAINLEQLQDLTRQGQSVSQTINEHEEALQALQEENDAKLAEKVEELTAMIERQILTATIEQIALRCEIAALEGKTQVDIFAIQFDETIGDPWNPRRGEKYEPTNPENLLGVAKDVYQYLVEAGLKPTIEQGVTDDDDSDTKCNIYANWE